MKIYHMIRGYTGEQIMTNIKEMWNKVESAYNHAHKLNQELDDLESELYSMNSEEKSYRSKVNKMHKLREDVKNAMSIHGKYLSEARKMESDLKVSKLLKM